MLAIAIAVSVMALGAAGQDKVLTYRYQAYSGSPLPRDQVATLDPGELVITLDGRDLAYDWDGLMREGCKAHRPNNVTRKPYRCMPTHLLIEVPPGRHTIGVELFGSGGIHFSGPDCTSSSCRFSKAVSVEASRTYLIRFNSPSGFVYANPTPMFPSPSITVVEKENTDGHQ